MILLLMQQNRQVTRDDARDEADFRIDIKAKEIAEQNTKILKKLSKQTAIIEKLIKQHDKKGH